MTTAERQAATSHLEQTFREWVRKGMREPTPSFEALRGISDYLPADVIEMLVTERGLTSFWNYGQAVSQLSEKRIAAPTQNPQQGASARSAFLSPMVPSSMGTSFVVSMLTGAEPDGDWLNDSTRPLIHAIAPRGAAQLALRTAEETDARVAKLPLDRMAPLDPDSPIDPARGEHRGEHLDELERAPRNRG